MEHKYKWNALNLSAGYGDRLNRTIHTSPYPVNLFNTMSNNIQGTHYANSYWYADNIGRYTQKIVSYI